MAKVTRHTGDTPPGDSSIDPRAGMQRVSTELEAAINRERNRAKVFGTGAVLVAVGGIVFLTRHASESFAKISAAASAVPPVSDTAIVAETTYLVVRGTGMSAIVAGVVYFMFNLARSSLDQSTRYEKRWIASHLIEYALNEPSVDLKRLAAALKIVEVWGSTIESAYTPPRVAKNMATMKVSAGKDGGTYEQSEQPGP